MFPEHAGLRACIIRREDLSPNKVSQNDCVLRTAVKVDPTKLIMEEIDASHIIKGVVSYLSKTRALSHTALCSGWRGSEREI
jgi:hypothetical protein